MAGGDASAVGGLPASAGEVDMGGFDAKRVASANTGVRPAAAKWGTEGAPPRPDSAAETYDTKPTTTRSAGSLLMEGEGEGGGDRHSRPHTAHGGRGNEVGAVTGRLN